MHQRIPKWKSICWCSQIWKHCIWISTKGTLQFIQVLLSLAFVVKEGEIYCHIFLKFVWIVDFAMKFLHKGRVCYLRGRLLKEGESIILEGELFCWHIVLIRTCFQISFCYDMLCCHQCQRGRLLDTIDNCVLSLMLHKCHIRYQSITELRHSTNEKSVLTELTRSSKKNRQTVLTELTRSSKKKR